MFYKKNTRFARLKAIVVLPLAVCIVMIYALGCKQSANKSSETTVATEAPVQTAPTVQPNGSVPPPPPPPPPPPITKSTNEDPVYTIVKPMPQFPGGEVARNKYIANTIKYPAEAIEKGLQGTVYVSFIVEKDGSIGDVKVLRGIGKSCDEEAVRTVRNMPKWKPGSYNGKAVRVLFNMPIYFKLN